ncbi:serine/threonine-protein phosphatase [Leptospira wolffii]|uniref:PP2C family protein-serine/threonine phosphatase n=1 Tax=Leptospira wolffii TaxID=409998 RepID=UPI0010834680|nr:PP2C family protein-serine/threonine phosphatase [Leptospira wolffii]TGK55249.1 serine/threonine-protein phosphatase [Leptospira wolffii]TGK65758.1 serine/threonine-protein phosphatase [Leptospira wolffii]TGK70450.1 serine/threonine-protein phosphatase [Leptospira wolffii]TGL30014.1 serine/threonine-protein phosphatase [Leptospira wolffii]
MNPSDKKAVGILNPWTFLEKEFNYKEVSAWKDFVRIDQSFIRLAFFLHFSVYLLLLIPEVRDSGRAAVYFGLILSLNVLSIVLSFQRKYLPAVIHGTNCTITFLVMLILNDSFYVFDDFHSLQLYNNYFLLVGFLVLFQMFRLKIKGCLLTALYSVLLHLGFVFFKLKDSPIHGFPLVLFVPDMVYLILSLIGTAIVVIVRRLVRISSELDSEYRFLQHELQIARKVQETLFPEEISIKGFRYEVFRSTPNEIGGDFYDFIQLREGNTGVFLTDIAGHGIASALVASFIKIMVATMPYRLKLHPVRLLEYLDETLLRQFKSHHASAVYIFFDFISKEIHFANGGHPYLIHSQNGEEFREIETTGSILGFGIKRPIAELVSVPIISGERLFLYTDGLIENRNPQGKQLGSEGLIEILNRNKSVRDLKQFKEFVQTELLAFFRDAEFEDDTLFLIIEME